MKPPISYTFIWQLQQECLWRSLSSPWVRLCQLLLSSQAWLHICLNILYSRKIWWGIKFGSLASRVETAKLKSVNIIFVWNAWWHNTCSSALGPTQHPSMQTIYVASLALYSTLPVILFVNLQTHCIIQVPSKRTATCAMFITMT